MEKSALFRTVLIIFSLIFTQAANAVSVNWGALATSTITTCSVTECPAIDSMEDGSTGMQAFATTTKNTNGNQSFAEATLSDTNFTPILRASSSALGPDVLLVISSASGVQSFQNTSGSAMDITLDLMLTTKPVTGLASINAFAAIYKDTTELEITGDSVENAVLNGFDNVDGLVELSEPSVSPQPTTTSFMVENNEHFLIWVGLFTSAFSGGTADASETLTMQLLDTNSLQPIDTTLLNPASAIPLPAAGWLFLSAIGILAGLSHRRKRQS